MFNHLIAIICLAFPFFLIFVIMQDNHDIDGLFKFLQMYIFHNNLLWSFWVLFVGLLCIFRHKQ